MVIFVGDDWAEDHHDVHLMDETGSRLAARRFPEGAVGIGALHALIAQYADDPGQVVVGIETDRGYGPGPRPQPAIRSSRSTRSQPPATASAISSRGRSLIPEMPRCWLIWESPPCFARSTGFRWVGRPRTDRTPLNPIGIGDVRPSAGH
jgi:hypothetical protein